MDPCGNSLWLLSYATRILVRIPEPLMIQLRVSYSISRLYTIRELITRQRKLDLERTVIETGVKSIVHLAARKLMLTILQMLPDLETGGVEQNTLEIGQALNAAGHRSLVMSGGGRMVTALELGGTEHHTWPIGRKSLWTLRLIPGLRRFLTEQRVDIVHARSRVPAWLAYLALRGMDPDQRPRFVTTVHGIYSVNRYSAVMARGEQTICVSHYVKDYVLTNYPQTDPKRLVVIDEGLDRDQYPSGYQPSPAWLESWRQQYPELQGRFILTLPGRITRLKGHEGLLKTVRGLREHDVPAHGLIVGEPPQHRQRYFDDLQRWVDEMALRNHITFTGHRDDVREIMAISDILFSFSTTPESFGRTTLEALSLGRPVIGYDHGGVGEQLSRLFPQGRVPLHDWKTAQETALRWWHDGHPPVPTQIPYSLERMCEETLELYSRLASPNRQAGRCP